MAEIVSFPSPSVRKRQALDILAGRVAAHMAKVFYDRDILDVPVQRYARSMVEIMMEDGQEYSEEVLQQMGTDPAYLRRIETAFIQTLVNKGVLDKA